jgi:3-oxoacyl-ACP reductase-like protein
LRPAAPVVAAPAPAAPVAPAPAATAGAFDPDQFGDLTEFHEEDLDFVAAKKGVDLDTIKRARRLQMLAKA